MLQLYLRGLVREYNEFDENYVAFQEATAKWTKSEDVIFVAVGGDL